MGEQKTADTSRKENKREEGTFIKGNKKSKSIGGHYTMLSKRLSS